nr:hypothetical protein Iba_chr05cCG14580 [Ipomoea batatas]
MESTFSLILGTEVVGRFLKFLPGKADGILNREDSRTMEKLSLETTKFEAQCNLGNELRKSAAVARGGAEDPNPEQLRSAPAKKETSRINLGLPRESPPAQPPYAVLLHAGISRDFPERGMRESSRMKGVKKEGAYLKTPSQADWSEPELGKLCLDSNFEGNGEGGGPKGLDLLLSDTLDRRRKGGL